MVEEFRIHPNTVKELRTGQAVLITKTPHASALVLNIAAPEPTAQPA